MRRHGSAIWRAWMCRAGPRRLIRCALPRREACGGGLWGSVQAHGLLRDAVVVSDDAGQFAVGEHALCWVHAERLVHRLETFTGSPAQGAAARPGSDLVVLPRSEGLLP